ncbi:MAG: SDR family oxidoreductase [Myxococcota bacterium]|nr:SDR family oxidoreductase [Myxococcota bacterium]
MSSYLIFGATSGIGAAIAEDALERGAQVIALGRNPTALDLLQQKGATTLQVDLSDGDARKGLWRDLNRYQSTVNRVVYAAGIAVRGTANEMEPDGLRTMFEVNTLAALELIGWSSGLVSGSILTLLSSNLAQHPLPHTVGYSASKAAVEAACRSAAGTLGRSGIRINAIAPGPVDTPMLRGQFETKEAAEAGLTGLGAAGPLGRIGAVSDVVKTLRYIEEASWLTGQVITIDGGFSCPA